MAADPLIETLFRPAAAASAVASAAPVRAPGTRSRAGNAMSRTRGALLDGARRAVEASGTKITMAQVASASGVAKATLYNHFRTRDAVLSALLVDEVRVLIERQDGKPLAGGWPAPRTTCPVTGCCARWRWSSPPRWSASPAWTRPARPGSSPGRP